MLVKIHVFVHLPPFTLVSVFILGFQCLDPNSTNTQVYENKAGHNIDFILQQTFGMSR